MNENGEQLGMEFKVLGLSPEDSQFLEMRRLMVDNEGPYPEMEVVVCYGCEEFLEIVEDMKGNGDV